MSLDITKIKDKPGVYLLKDKSGDIVYVGKAANLKKRLKFYLKPASDLRINKLISKIENIDTFEVDSEIEALILESNLIKKYKPEFNVQLKDDKDYLYIIITKDKYPKVLPARKKAAKDASVYFGPFPSGLAVRRTLKLIRRVFPYSTCKPNTGRACLHFHLGLCPGVCVGETPERQYKKNIQNIKMFLWGKNDKIYDNLKKEMKAATSELKYEEALKIHGKLKSLDHILQPRRDVASYMDDPEFIKTYRAEEIKELKRVLNLSRLPRRIEGYDISNIHGEFATGSMVVFVDAAADKKEYRKFRIKRVRGISDTDMMEEILSRRFSNDWELPDLIILDGGKGQLSACLKVLRAYRLSINCASLAKKLEQIYLPNKKDPVKLPTNSKALHLVQRLRDEAHRFAITYHRHLRDKNVLTVEKRNVRLNK